MTLRAELHPSYDQFAQRLGEELPQLQVLSSQIEAAVGFSLRCQVFDF